MGNVLVRKRTLCCLGWNVKLPPRKSSTSRLFLEFQRSLGESCDPFFRRAAEVLPDLLRGGLTVC